MALAVCGSLLLAAAPAAVPKQTSMTVKKGAMVELMATVNRLGGYTGPVQLQLVQLPGNVSAPAVTVAENATEGKLVINAAANAANGSFANVLLRGTAQVGGQAVNIDAQVTLVVE